MARAYATSPPLPTAPRCRLTAYVPRDMHPTMTQPPTRYTDDDARRILERAAELDVPDADAMSLTELEAIAAEAGISPDAVRQAARGELVVAENSGDDVMAIVPGRWTDDEVNAALDRARAYFGAEGTTARAKDRVQWQTTGRGMRYIEVVITRSPTSSTITVSESTGLTWLFGLGGGGFLGAIGGGGALAAMGLTLPGAAAAGAIVLSGVWGGVAIAWLRNRRRRDDHRAFVRQLGA